MVGKHYGIIGVHHHRIDCIIGVTFAERSRFETIYVNVKIKIDLTAALSSEALGDTVSYVLLADLCTELARSKNYILLEELAHDILEQCKIRYQPVWAWVHVQKPSAIPTAEYAFVEMEWQEEL